MRAINKKCNLSTSYKSWLRKLESNKKKHPLHSSQHKFYRDVVMNLFHCQRGLCAYTETFLCPEEYYATNNWDKGIYRIKAPLKIEFEGHLDHFDPRLKKRRAWLWNNLFMVRDSVN